MTFSPTGPPERWLDALRESGFALIEGFLSAGELAAARAAFGAIYPSPEEYFADPRQHTWLQGDPFAGLRMFPFGDAVLDDLPVSDGVVALVESALETRDIRLLRANLQAKYAGAADYDQVLHRDYPNHSLLVPADAPADRQLGFFLYLNDVTSASGATRLVPTPSAPAPTGGDTHYFRSPDAARRAGRHTNHHRPGLYDSEVAAAGLAGALLVYDLATLHRGAAITAADGARLTVSFAYGAGNAWSGRQSWPELGEDEQLAAFLARATPRQLQLFGFPPARHAYWTAATRAAVRARYPGIRLPSA